MAVTAAVIQREAEAVVEELMASYTDNPKLMVISGLAFLIGYVEYVYSFRLLIREKAAPFPIWVHTFYLAHDATAAVVFFLLAKQHDWFWFFTAASGALLVWNLFELFNLFKAVTVERQEIWGRQYPTPVAPRQAVLRILGQVALMTVLVNLFRVFMDDETMFKWLLLTNVVMAVGPGQLWAQRQSRRGASVGLAAVILVGTVNTFLPPGWGMWTTALHYFDQPWFYVTGAVASAYALRNLVTVLRFPAKEAAGGKRPIW